MKYYKAIYNIASTITEPADNALPIINLEFRYRVQVDVETRVC